MDCHEHQTHHQGNGPLQHHESLAKLSVTDDSVTTITGTTEESGVTDAGGLHLYRRLQQHRRWQRLRRGRQPTGPWWRKLNFPSATSVKSAVSSFLRFDRIDPAGLTRILRINSVIHVKRGIPTCRFDRLRPGRIDAAQKR